MYIYHIYFIHLSVDEHLECVHILAIINNAAGDTGACIFFHWCFHLGGDIYTQKWNCYVVW